MIHSADYLERGLTPHLLAISKKGLRAKALQPIFPVRFLFLFLVDILISLEQTLTFP